MNDFRITIVPPLKEWLSVTLAIAIAVTVALSTKRKNAADNTDGLLREPTLDDDVEKAANDGGQATGGAALAASATNVAEGNTESRRRINNSLKRKMLALKEVNEKRNDHVAIPKPIRQIHSTDCSVSNVSAVTEFCSHIVSGAHEIPGPDE